jgi:hypothetical protein
MLENIEVFHKDYGHGVLEEIEWKKYLIKFKEQEHWIEWGRWGRELFLGKNDYDKSLQGISINNSYYKQKYKEFLQYEEISYTEFIRDKFKPKSEQIIILSTYKECICLSLERKSIIKIGCIDNEIASIIQVVDARYLFSQVKPLSVILAEIVQIHEDYYSTSNNFTQLKKLNVYELKTICTNMEIVKKDKSIISPFDNLVSIQNPPEFTLVNFTGSKIQKTIRKHGDYKYQIYMKPKFINIDYKNSKVDKYNGFYFVGIALLHSYYDKKKDIVNFSARELYPVSVLDEENFRQYKQVREARKAEEEKQKKYLIEQKYQEKIKNDIDFVSSFIKKYENAVDKLTKDGDADIEKINDLTNRLYWLRNDLFLLQKGQCLDDIAIDDEVKRNDRDNIYYLIQTEIELEYEKDYEDYCKEENRIFEEIEIPNIEEEYSEFGEDALDYYLSYVLPEEEYYENNMDQYYDKMNGQLWERPMVDYKKYLKKIDDKFDELPFE